MEAGTIAYDVIPLNPTLGPTLEEEDPGFGILQIEARTSNSDSRVMGRALLTLVQNFAEAVKSPLDDEIADYIRWVSDPDGGFRMGVTRTLGLPDRDIGRDLLLVQNLEILPAYRGHGVGHDILQACIRHFGQRAALVVLKAFPLQFELYGHPAWRWGAEWARQMHFDQMPRDLQSSRSRLVDYYRGAGFAVLQREIALMGFYNRAAV